MEEEPRSSSSSQSITIYPGEPIKSDIINHIADNGGEASFRTVKGRIEDLHITESY